MPCLALRIGFVGELGYELHCAASVGEHLWDALVGAGARPFGLEPQRVLRLEKAHVIVGQDTDSESNLLSAGMPWIVKLDKDDFVGKWALSTSRRGCASGSSASRCRRRCRSRARRSCATGAPAGRVTSARVSERLGTGDRPRLGRAGAAPRTGTPIAIRVDGALHDRDGDPRAVLRPEGSAAPVVSRLAFLSPHEADVDGRLAASPRRGAAFTDVSQLGKLEVRGDVDPARAAIRARARRARCSSSTATCAPSATG